MRKHFKTMAGIISKITNHNEKVAAARGAIDLFARDNPRFDVKRFLAACGLDSI
jgi:hypothetical protein